MNFSTRILVVMWEMNSKYISLANSSYNGYYLLRYDFLNSIPTVPPPHNFHTSLHLRHDYY